MSISIGTTVFDDYEGAIVVPKLRVESFSRTDVAHSGAQVMPKAGRVFSIETLRYESSVGSVEATKIFLDSLIGTVASVSADGISYAAFYSVNFVVVDVQHDPVMTFVRARGLRGGFDINYAPAHVLRSRWQLQATPTS